MGVDLENDSIQLKIWILLLTLCFDSSLKHLIAIYMNNALSPSIFRLAGWKIFWFICRKLRRQRLFVLKFNLRSVILDNEI